MILLILTNKYYDYAVIEKRKIFFGFLYYHFSRRSTKIKQNKVGIKTTFLLMMKIRKAKSPKQVHFHLGWDERIFFLKSRKQQIDV